MSEVFVQPTTLVLLFNDRDEVLLGFKKRGFGQGKWNGFGGKVQLGESILDAALRELEEEAGIVLESGSIREHGQIRFEFQHDPLWYQDMTIFVGSYCGPFRETDEMSPQWWPINALPYDEMREDDSIWMKDLLAGRYVRYHFVFDACNRVVSNRKLA